MMFFGAFLFGSLMYSEKGTLIFLCPHTQARGYLQLSSYTIEPWRVNELFSPDTKVIVRTSHVGSGELEGGLQRTEFDRTGDSSEYACISVGSLCCRCRCVSQILLSSS